MANIKSAKKRVLVNAKKAARNKAAKSGVKTAVKKVYAAIEAGDKALATEKLSALQAEMGRATSKGIFKKNTTSRKIARMAKAVNKIEA